MLALVALSISIAAAPTPLATKADVEAAVKAVRKQYEAVAADAKKGKLATAKMTMGGGQNPNEIEVVYEGGSEADYEKDPYAAPFRLRQVVVSQVEPAIGDTRVEFTFSRDGALLFAFEGSVQEETRAYFADGAVFRIHTKTRDEKDTVVDVAPADARKHGAKLATQAAALKQALETLAR